MPTTLKSRLPRIAAQLGPSVAAAVKAGAEAVERTAKERVAVDQGDLRNAIHTEADRDGIYVVAGNETIFYGHLVEGGATHTPPRPFLVPALEANRDVITGFVAASIRRL